MSLNKKHQFVLYALMEYLKELNEKFSDKPLEASVSKIDFIRLLQDLKIVEKSERGIYKNLEILENKKLIKYENKFLKLTEKGLKATKQKELELYPYSRLTVTLKNSKPVTSPQSYFK